MSDEMEEFDKCNDLLISNSSRLLSDTKSELIQRILDSFKSSSSIDKTIISCQSLNFSNKIYIHFKDKNELGRKPHIDDLLEKIECTKKCLCQRMEIIFNNSTLNQELSYKEKESILRIILRRQQIFDRYFS